MFHITKEGEEPKNGFNFYPLNDPNSFGGKFRLGRRLWTVRYSTARSKWFIHYVKFLGKEEVDAIIKGWK